MHTKEPWHVEINESEDANFCDRWPTIHSADSEIIGTEGLFSEIETDKKNARRIVACVNACAGIPTDDLERVKDEVTPVFELLMQATKQRDELLAAAKLMRPFITDEAVPQRYWSVPFADAVTALDAAISNASK